MLPEGGPAHHFGCRLWDTMTPKSFKIIGKQTLLKIPATQQIRVGAGSPLRCLSGAPATHWRGSTLDKVSQNPFKIIGKQTLLTIPASQQTKVPLVCSRLQQGSLEPASHSKTATDLLGNSSQTIAFVMCYVILPM